MPLIVSSTPVSIIPLNIKPHMDTQQIDIFQDIKSCAEKNITTATKSNILTVPNSFRPLESTSSTISNSVLPITDNAFIPYITHTYFTLDDVIIPAASDNYKAEIRNKKLIPYNSDIKKSLTSEKSKPLNNLTTESFSEIPTVPTESVVTVQPTIPWIPIATTLIAQKQIEKTTSAPLTNQTIIDYLPPLAIIKNITTPTETSLPENQTQIIRIKEFCSNCLKTKINLTNATHNKVESFESNSSNVIHGKKPIKNLTLKSIQANKIEIKKDFKKLGVIPNVPRISEVPVYKTRRNISNQLYMRRRKLDRQFTKSNNTNNYQAKNQSQLVEPTVRLNQNKTNVDKINIRTVKPMNKTKIIPETASTVATTALATESAIMTISNTNGKFLKGSIARSRRIKSHIINQVDLIQTTVTPQLPIEVYFTKLGKAK